MKKFKCILKITIILLFLLYSNASVFCSSAPEISKTDTVVRNGDISLRSQLLIPDVGQKPPVVLLIAGSGPTDMNGNNPMMTNNSLKFLAQDLAKKGIASLRYDKRTVAANQNNMEESEIRFGDFVDDAVKCLEFLKNDKRFGDIYIIGHSQGSLVGMLAAKRIPVSGFISIAGAGEPIGETLVRQISAQSAQLGEETEKIVDSLEAGHTVKNVNPMLAPVFHASVQPFLISWMKYDPTEVIGELNIPVLIIQGTTDIQVTRQDAQRLKEADPQAMLVFIEGMNHIFKQAPEERTENMKTYMNPDLPVVPELVDTVADFIKQ